MCLWILEFIEKLTAFAGKEADLVLKEVCQRDSEPWEICFMESNTSMNNNAAPLRSTNEIQEIQVISHKSC